MRKKAEVECCRQKEQQVKKPGCEGKNRSHWGTERCSWRRASEGGGEEEAGGLSTEQRIACLYFGPWGWEGALQSVKRADDENRLARSTLWLQRREQVKARQHSRSLIRSLLQRVCHGLRY